LFIKIEITPDKTLFEVNNELCDEKDTGYTDKNEES